MNRNINKRIKAGLIALLLAFLLADTAQAAAPVSPPESRFVWEPGENLTFTWTHENFDGFYYDPENGAGNEWLTIILDRSKNRSIQPNGIVYSTTVAIATARYRPFGEYAVIGFMGEKCLAGFPEGKSNITNKSGINLRPLHKILIDENDNHTQVRGSSLALEEGYVLEIKDVDLTGASAALMLKKNGAVADTKTVSAGRNYIYEIQDRPIIAVHIDSVLEGNGTVSAAINGIFQISEYHTPVNAGDIFGVMKIINVSDRSITMKNTLDTVDLKRGSIIEIIGRIKLKIADSNTLRVHLYSDCDTENCEHRGAAGSKEHSFHDHG